MKVSKKWLQKFFDVELPSTDALAEGLMFHAFEVEEVIEVGAPRQGDDASDEVLDLKVLQRGHDCLGHRGVAKEISAIFKLPLAHDPLAGKPDLSPKTDMVAVEIEDTNLCRRYVAGYIKGVKVGPSPKWLQERLEAIGQKPINNIVDATNFVMFNIGQPLHAFDASKLKHKGRSFMGSDIKDGPLCSIVVRKAKAGEKITALDGKEYELQESMLVISDGNSGDAIGIAGV